MARAPLDLKRFDVVLAPVFVGKCKDPRRCIVLDLDAETGLVKLQPCSSQPDLFNELHDMWIDGTETEPPKQGFKCRSYAIGPDNPKIEGLCAAYGDEIRSRYLHLCPEQEKQLKDRYGWD